MATTRSSSPSDPTKSRETVMIQRYDVLGFGLIAVAVALFSLTGTTDDFFTDKSWLYRYQSLLGSLIAATGTILAGWLAFRRQVVHAAEVLAKSQTGARLAAIKQREKNVRVYEQVRTLYDKGADLADRRTPAEYLVSWGCEVERCLFDAGHLGEAELFRTKTTSHQDRPNKLRLILGRLAKLAEAGSQVLAHRDEPVA